MNLLIISSACRQDIYDKIFYSRKEKKVDPAQKFFNLLIRGLASDASNIISCVSVIPVSKSSHIKRYWKQEWFYGDNNLNYIIPRFINGKVCRFISQNVSVIGLCKEWLKKNKNETNKIIIVDPIIYHVTSSVRRLAQKYNCKTVAILTDIPQKWLSMNKYTQSKSRKKFTILYNEFATKDLKNYDGYIFLTEQMNEFINSKNRPYIVVEGTVDSLMNNVGNNLNSKDFPKVIMYAGGIHKVFGIITLIEAFIKANLSDTELHVYGSGEQVEEIKEYSKKYSKIRYMGVVPAEEIVNREIKATLLINPRPINDEYTLYSFPSKTLEYMVSGTPVLSTRLPGIPSDYNDYLYWFDDSDIDSMKKKIIEVMSMSSRDLNNFGLRSKKYVLRNKSNILQAERIIKFILNEVLQVEEK